MRSATSRGRLLGGAAEQDSELVAAQSRDDVAVAHGVPDSLRHRLQQQIAAVMAERVVDLLEAIEVDDHHRAGVARGLLGQRLPGVLEERAAVGQRGERIEPSVAVVLIGLPAQLPRGPGHDPEQQQVEEEQSDRQRQIQPVGVVRDRRGDRGVRGVDLEGSVRQPEA